MKEIVILYVLTFILFSVRIGDKWCINILLLFTLAFVLMSAYKWRLLTMWWNSVLCFPLGMYCARNKQFTDLLKRNNIVLLLLFIFIISFTVNTVCHSRYIPHAIGDLIAPVSMVVSSACFALFVISAMRFVDIHTNIFDYVGKNSLIFYLSHIFLIVSITPISHYWLYALLVAVGTLVLSYIYVQMNRKFNYLNS